MNGYCGKMLIADLTKRTYEEQELTQEMAEHFIGGYGIGARVLFDMMGPGVDPLGPGNIIGFTTGPLTATGALLSGRYTVVCKSPVTGGWNDANSGGYFGPELKKAGYDAVFITGAAESPVYLWINDGEVVIKDAVHLWGKDVVETEETVKAELKDSKLRIAAIGPAGEKLSLIAAVMNDGHRAAGRGGCGAVMGSKNLKAVVIRGTGKVPVADPDNLKAINQEVLNTIKKGPMAQIAGFFSDYGTTGSISGSTFSGDSPVKNWTGVGIVDCDEESAKSFDGPSMDPKYRIKKFACANCPVGCGAIYNVKTGKWPVGETGRPEYETASAFGTLVLNKDVEALIKCNHICNINGMDTISAGATIAWAMECYENGLFSKGDTGGITLTWGNAAGMVETLQEMVNQTTDFGKLLSLGSAGAAEKIGKGKEFLVTANGVELPMHDPRFGPGFARTYATDPTPGRHVKGGLGLRHMQSPDESKYNTNGTGEEDLKATMVTEINNTAGLCMFQDLIGVENLARKFLTAVTGRSFGAEEEQKTGLRIFNMRHAFNLREGLKPAEILLPKRCVGEPPQTEGPLKGITVSNMSLIKNFFRVMEWDETTGRPSRTSLEKLGGLDNVITSLKL